MPYSVQHSWDDPGTKPFEVVNDAGLVVGIADTRAEAEAMAQRLNEGGR